MHKSVLLVKRLRSIYAKMMFQMQNNDDLFFYERFVTKDEIDAVFFLIFD